MIKLLLAWSSVVLFCANSVASIVADQHEICSIVDQLLEDNVIEAQGDDYYCGSRCIANYVQILKFQRQQPNADYYVLLNKALKTSKEVSDHYSGTGIQTDTLHKVLMKVLKEEGLQATITTQSSLPLDRDLKFRGFSFKNELDLSDLKVDGSGREMIFAGIYNGDGLAHAVLLFNFQPGKTPDTATMMLMDPGNPKPVLVKLRQKTDGQSYDATFPVEMRYPRVDQPGTFSTVQIYTFTKVTITN